MKPIATLLGVCTQPKHDEEYNWTGAAISAAIEVEAPEEDGAIGLHRAGLNIDLSPALIDIVKVSGYDFRTMSYMEKRVAACMKAIEKEYLNYSGGTYYIYWQIMVRMPKLIEKSVAKSYYRDNLRTGEVEEYGIDQIDYIKH